jgi:hypothetical protein
LWASGLGAGFGLAWASGLWGRIRVCMGIRDRVRARARARAIGLGPWGWGWGQVATMAAGLHGHEGCPEEGVGCDAVHATAL